MFKCNNCGSTWGGANTAHCPACHQTFTGQTAADRHRAGSHAKGERHCISPAEAGLEDAGRKYPCWAIPGVNDHWDN